MALTVGPLMSLDASGSVAGTIVFSKWKGRNYVRQLVTPANPKSRLQVSTRAMMKFLSQQWSPETTALQKATWEADAAAMAASPFNAFIKTNLRRWTQFTAPTKETPIVANGTLPTFTSLPASVGAVGQITITWDLNALNDAWGLLIFRDTVNPVVSGRNTLIGVALLKTLTSDTFVDTPVAAGSYFLNYRSFTDDTVLSAQLGQTTATVT
jgi:hypothetical protein